MKRWSGSVKGVGFVCWVVVCLFSGSLSRVFLIYGITALTSKFYQNTHKITLFQLFQTNFHILDKKIFLMIIMYIYINKNYHSFHLRGVVNKTIQFFQNENPCSQSNPTTPNPPSPHFPTFFSSPSFLSSIPSFIFSLFSSILYLKFSLKFPLSIFLYYICLLPFPCLTLIFIYDTIKLIFYNY